MVYTQKEKERMDNLLQIIGSYVTESTQIDIAYSDKTGYVRLIIAPYEDYVFFPIESFDDMLETFFFDILCDEVSRSLEENPDLTNAEMDYLIVFLRLGGYVLKLGEDRAHAMELLKKFIWKWMNSDVLP